MQTIADVQWVNSNVRWNTTTSKEKEKKKERRFSFRVKVPPWDVLGSGTGKARRLGQSPIPVNAGAAIFECDRWVTVQRVNAFVELMLGTTDCKASSANGTVKLAFAHHPGSFVRPLFCPRQQTIAHARGLGKGVGVAQGSALKPPGTMCFAHLHVEKAGTGCFALSGRTIGNPAEAPLAMACGGRVDAHRHDGCQKPSKRDANRALDATQLLAHCLLQQCTSRQPAVAVNAIAVEGTLPMAVVAGRPQGPTGRGCKRRRPA